MRDLLILAVLPVLLYAMSKRPFIALGMWVWTALFFPNGWLYGMAGNIRFNLLFAGVTVIGYVLIKNKPKIHLSTTGAMVLLFFAWATISTILGIGRPDVAWDIWNRFLKVIVLFLFVLMIVEKKLHVDFMLWCVVLSVGFYADLESLKFLASGGGHKIEGMAGHVLGDRNELSIAFTMTLPICYYLLNEYGKQSRLLMLAMLGTMGLLVAGVIGTQSRGGFISLIALGGYMFMKSERKILMGIMIAVLVAGMAQLVSSEWTSRIDTINDANEDASFMGRVVAWKLSLLLAFENPIFGGGFKALEYYPVWTHLSQDFFTLDWFYSAEAVPDAHPHAAHSVYFQVLGDHGFGGLAIYLSFLIGSFLRAGRIARKAIKLQAPPWIRSVATMLQLSVFVFSLGGAALSFAYFDLIFAIIGLLIVLEYRILPAAVRGELT